MILLFVESNTNIKPTKPMKFKSKNLCSEIIENNRKHTFLDKTLYFNKYTDVVANSYNTITYKIYYV